MDIDELVRSTSEYGDTYTHEQLKGKILDVDADLRLKLGTEFLTPELRKANLSKDDEKLFLEMVDIANHISIVLSSIARKYYLYRIEEIAAQKAWLEVNSEKYYQDIIVLKEKMIPIAEKEFNDELTRKLEEEYPKIYNLVMDRLRETVDKSRFNNEEEYEQALKIWAENETKKRLEALIPTEEQKKIYVERKAEDKAKKLIAQSIIGLKKAELMDQLNKGYVPSYFLRLFYQKLILTGTKDMGILKILFSRLVGILGGRKRKKPSIFSREEEEEYE